MLDLQDGLSEEQILANLPEGHDCQDIRLIKIDGEVKGAALVFSAATRPRVPRPQQAPMLPLPGVQIDHSDLRIVGSSEAILEALDIAERISTVNTPTLIEGETGVGKELFARLIHSRMDPQQAHRFTAINCGAITPQMFADGLWPRPDADAPAPLCLDEIGELPTEMQPFLLRVLEERLTGLDGRGQSEPSIRVLSLTNRTLLDEVDAGRFRRDLFYRLSAVILKIPPLRERGEDILLIAEHYNRRISAETGRDLLIIGTEVQDLLMGHRWPGNVRELRNLISRLHNLARARQVTPADLPREITAPSATAGPVPAGEANPDRRQPYARSLRDAEVVLIENTLIEYHGNISRTAAALGISRPTLYRKIQHLGIRAGA